MIQTACEEAAEREKKAEQEKIATTLVRVFDWDIDGEMLGRWFAEIKFPSMLSSGKRFIGTGTDRAVGHGHGSFELNTASSYNSFYFSHNTQGSGGPPGRRFIIDDLQ